MPIDRYIDDYFALEKFVSLCLQGLELGAEARSHVDLSERAAKALRRPSPFSTPEEREDAVRRASDLEVFSQAQKAQGFPFLYGLAAIKMWALLEAAVDDLVADQLRQHRASKFPLLARAKGLLVEFIDATEEEKIDILAQKIRDSTDAALKKGIGRFEAVLDAVFLGGSLPESIRKTLFELSEVRNVLVHRNATADRRFRDACPWFGADPGSPIDLVPNHYKMYSLATLWYFVELDNRVLRASGEAVPGAQVSLQADIVRKVDLFRSSRERESDDGLPDGMPPNPPLQPTSDPKTGVE